MVTGKRGDLAPGCQWGTGPNLWVLLLSGRLFTRHLMVSQQGPLREGDVLNGEPEPQKVGAAGTNKEAEVGTD